MMGSPTLSVPVISSDDLIKGVFPTYDGLQGSTKTFIHQEYHDICVLKHQTISVKQCTVPKQEFLLPFYSSLYPTINDND